MNRSAGSSLASRSVEIENKGDTPSQGNLERSVLTAATGSRLRNRERLGLFPGGVEKYVRPLTPRGTTDRPLLKSPDRSSVNLYQLLGNRIIVLSGSAGELRVIT